jgi:hypothetical protein
MARKLTSNLVLVALLLAANACTPLDRGDVHLTVEVQEDHSCSLQVEFDIPPLSDWFGSLMPEIQNTQDNPRSQEQPLELLRTSRDSQEYSAILIHFSDTNRLESLVNTASFAQEVLPWLEDLLETADEEIGVPDEVTSVLSNLPTPFSRLQIRMNDASPLRTTYQFEAEVNATTSSLVAPFADVAYHVILPGSVASSDAHRTDHGVLTWDLREGEALHMEAQSRVSKIGLANTGVWILGIVCILLLALIAGSVIYYSMSRRRRTVPFRPGQVKEPDSDYSDDCGDPDIEISSQDIWSEYEDLDSYSRDTDVSF